MATVPTVYFIDDSATMREVIKIAFRRENINVLTSHDAVLALEEIEKNRPDIVITDVIMPVKDGYEVCQFIKSHTELAKTPVILMSGVVNRAVAERAFAVKADELLRKPFQPQDLISRVRNLLVSKGGTRPSPVAAATANAALSNIFATTTPVPPRPATNPAMESAMAAIMSGPPVAMLDPESPALPAMAVASPFSVVVPDVDPLLEVANVPAKETEPKMPSRIPMAISLPTPPISPAAAVFAAMPVAQPKEPISSTHAAPLRGSASSGSNAPGGHAASNGSSASNGVSNDGASIQSTAKVSNGEFNRPGIEILRLEGLVRKLQAELQAERDYSKALEAHIKTLQDPE